MPIAYEQLEKVLLETELLTPEQLASAKKTAAASERPLEEVLIEEEFISEDHLGQIVADFFSVPYVDLKKRSIEEDVLRLIPEIVAKRQRIIAFERDANGLKLAMADPEDEEMQQFISKKTGETIIPYYASPRNIYDVLTHYRRGLKQEFDSIIKESVEESRQKSEQEREVPITRIVDTILEYAYDNKVSDIHIEPHEARVVVRFRIDGILHDVIDLPKEIHDLMVMRLKILSQLRTDEHRAAQDGRLEFKVDEGKVDVRISIIPVADGEKVVMRILSEKSRQFNLADLGFGPEDLKKVERNLKKPYGMILSTGPTGSGKTTTLYAVLKILNTREVNISTIEDPVEYDIEGVNQIQVNTKTNLTFAKGLRSILRQDPDIIMVGEIRDEETAGIAINSAMTGHLVLSTLHANDAPTTLPRLLDMHIEPFLIASTVNVAIGQRLVRKIHQNCLESYAPDAKEIAAIDEAIGKERATKMGLHKKGLRLYRGKGCKLCNMTGYEGRIGIFEVMEMTEDLRKLIMERANSDVIRTAALTSGMTTMLDDGVKKALQGITTIQEIMRATTE
jgi:type IV pilus assembly protein PilB